MKTALESLDALEALARKIATYYNTGSSLDKDIASEAVLWMRDAHRLVSELPEPIDPDLLEARELCCEDIRSNRPDVELEDGYRTGEYDKEDIMRVALAAIRKGRELEREGRK